MKNFNSFIADLKTLISFKSTHEPAVDGMPFGKPVADALSFFLKRANDFGLSAINYDNYLGEVYLGDNAPKNTPYANEIGVIGHLDVVPAGTNWQTDPFTLTKIGDTYYGRGIADDKAPILMCLYVLKELKESGLTLKRKIRLFVGCNEESGWKDVEYFEKNHTFPEYGFSPDGDFPVSYAEKGVVRVEFSIPKLKNFYSISGGTVVNAVCAYASVKATEKGIDKALLDKHGLILEGDTIISVGKSAHGSQPHLGKNALKALFNYFLDMGEDVKNVVDSLFNDKYGVFKMKNEQGIVTLSPNLIEEKDEKIIITADCRIPAPFNLDDVITVFDKFNIDYTTHVSHIPVMVEKQGWFVSTLLCAYNSVTGEKGTPISLGGSTFARVFKKGCAFGGEFPNQNNHIHEDGERMSEKALLDLYQIYKNAIFSLALD